MLVVGFVLPLPLGYWLISRAHADLLLTLLGLTSVPLLVWGASLGAEIGPCSVPDCMTSTQHSQLVVAIAALVILLVAFVLLSLPRFFIGGIVEVVALLVGAYSLLKTDLAGTFTLVIFAIAAIVYLVLRNGQERAATTVPDFPPVA